MSSALKVTFYKGSSVSNVNYAKGRVEYLPRGPNNSNIHFEERVLLRGDIFSTHKTNVAFLVSTIIILR